MSEELPDALLAEIRRAAFELRRTDPEEAVRVLRRIVGQGGAAAGVAHGALGGRGRLAEGDGGLARALPGFAGAAEALRNAQQRGEPLPPGAEEEVLGLLEVVVELAELRHQRGQNGSVQVDLDESLVGWAVKQRLFDALREEDEEGGEDWIRFHTLWTQLRVLTGRAAEAAASLAEAEAAGQIPAAAAARLGSDALEEADDLPAAANEAGRALGGAREGAAA